ncbi:uroporphyrinogen decarboxylase [Microbacterium awajiense]|uniref:Uroporphyrinogen decarboxylase n=1 Tax=Microbacterium awajiense TaxID=415214 RepID=A0ABP7ACS0_9MICO
MVTLAPDHPLRDGRTVDAPLLRAARGDRPAHRPVWFMRQAGRSLPEYRELRRNVAMLDACLDPALAAEITLQPVRRHGVDAAVFFSDIVVPPLLAGVGVRIVEGRGPVFDRPVRTRDDVRALPPLHADALQPIRETVGIVAAELGDVPVIGFGGAPFTLASYLVEGGPSKDQQRARAMMHADPEAWSALMTWCADVTTAFLQSQIAGGASVVQLFDSWAGSLSRADYERSVLPFSQRILTAVEPLGAPRIHFGLGTAGFLDLVADAGAEVIGVDWRLPLDEAARLVPGHPLQGNIDTALLAAPREVLHAHVADVLRRGDAAPAHIVNLGHGVPPDTDPGVLTDLVEVVHAAE